ncbi:MAG: apolipoprotein N-acyltransferase [Desulfobacteraceae bacterium]|nr:apolipoprotein N-acyltransferase [Desulfobacteraceae bacterium]
MDAVLLSILSGLLLTAGFPKPALYFLSWIALVPLFFAIRGKSLKHAFWLGYLCGVVHLFTVLFWIRYAIYHFGGFPFVVSLLILLLLCCMLALYPAVFSLTACWLEKQPALFVFGLPFVWVALEWMRAFFPFSGFPWSNIGYTQTPLNLLIQVADITGVYGLSWLVVLGSTVVAGFFFNYFRKSGVTLLAACIVAALFYGFWRLDNIKSIQGRAAPLAVSVIQGNIKQDEKWDPAFQTETISRYALFSQEALREEPVPDLLFWPESAMPFFYGIDEIRSPEVNRFVEESKKPVLFGSLGVTLIDGKARLLNRAYLLDGRGILKGAYAKQHLVPFGEYVPLSSVLFFVRHLAFGDMDFVPGKDPGPVFLNGLPMGVLICYEVIFPEISRESIRRGAQVLMNMTNDAWYGDTGGPYQHLDISRWRAIEFRVPLARAANTGVSAVFDATGAELGRIPLNTGGFLTRNIHPMPFLSFYAKYGDIFAWFSVFAAVFALLYRFAYFKMYRRISP